MTGRRNHKSTPPAPFCATVDWFSDERKARCLFGTGLEAKFMGQPSDDIDVIIESVMKHRPSGATGSRGHLGGGVYASYNNGLIELKRGDHHSEPLICLDHLTMQALISFARRQGP